MAVVLLFFRKRAAAGRSATVILQKQKRMTGRKDYKREREGDKNLSLFLLPYIRI